MQVLIVKNVFLQLLEEGPYALIVYVISKPLFGVRETLYKTGKKEGRLGGACVDEPFTLVSSRAFRRLFMHPCNTQHHRNRMD